MDNDIIDISTDFDSLDNIGSGSSWGSKKTNFGGGLELLMNDKQKASAGPTSDIDIDDLNNLENELNDLANTTAPVSNNFESGLFGSKLSFDDKPSVRFDESPSIGRSTSNTDSDAKTFDGYGKFNNIPINPDIHMSFRSKSALAFFLRRSMCSWRHNLSVTMYSMYRSVIHLSTPGATPSFHSIHKCRSKFRSELFGYDDCRMSNKEFESYLKMLKEIGDDGLLFRPMKC